MAGGTRFAKLDDAIKSLNDFRKETENQIRDLKTTITRFMHAIDQRWQLPLQLVIQTTIVFHIDL